MNKKSDMNFFFYAFASFLECAGSCVQIVGMWRGMLQEERLRLATQTSIFGLVTVTTDYLETWVVVKLLYEFKENI